ncbi:hypothetical protein Aperf_G00000056883 [Anoplocephala perfoliata]
MDSSEHRAQFDNVPGPSTYNAAEDYEAIQNQQEEIERSIKESGPLVCQPEPISVLAEDFVDHPVYLEKLELLKKKYTKIRRLRRDGNCFYRGFGFSYLEYLLKGKRIDETKRFLKFCDECKNTLIDRGYTAFTVEDFHEQFTTFVSNLILNGGSLSELEERFTNPGFSDYYVVFLRLCVSSYMQRNEDFYMNFISGEKTVKKFCETEVEPMGLESDNIHISALAQAIDVPINIENCQQSGELKKIEFPGRENEGAGERASAPVTLLYRPGHYDILYV